MTIPDGNDHEDMGVPETSETPEILGTSETPRDPNQGSGRATLIVLGAIVLIGVVIGLFLVLDIGGGDDAEPTAEVEIVEPAPAIVLTPLWDTIATLQADESVDPAEVEQIRQQLEQIDANAVSNEQLTTILNDLETNFQSQFIDTDELDNRITTLLDSEGFDLTVRDIYNQAQIEATQTQEAVECFVETLPEYTTVRVYDQPAEGAVRVDFIELGRKYRVISRTDGAYNTVTMWWQIDLDPVNNIRPWVRSDLVNESDETKCLAIAVR